MLPPKSSYGSINAVIYPVYYEVVEVAGLQTCFSHPEHIEAACRRNKEASDAFLFMASEKGAEPLNEAEDELDRWEEKLVFGMKEQRIDLCCEYCSSLPFTERSCWDLCCFFNV